MALPVYTSSAFTGQNGLEIAAGASVEVRSEADDSLVTLYSDRAGTVQIDNPMAADEYGRFGFYAAPNSDGWRITVTSGSDTHTLRYQQPMGSMGGMQAATFMMDFLASANAAAAQTALALADTYARLASANNFTETQQMPQISIRAVDEDTDPAGYLRDENGAAVGIWFYDRSDNTIRLRHSGSLKDIIIYESGGVALTGATGGDPGAGKFNAAGYEKNGTALPFQEAYESPGQAITQAGTLTLSHGLSSRPKLYLIYLRCLTAELGYAVGDEILVDQQAGASSGCAVYIQNSTQIKVRYADITTVFGVVRADTGVISNITPARWEFVLRAWA